MVTAHGHAVNGDCTIFYEAFGSTDDPTLLLVNGLGSQCINYEDAWCERFAAEGYRVVRFDNRDVGLTTHYGDAPVDDGGAAYTLRDMAADAVSVLDAVGVERAHVMGLSMGGMIVQQLAIHHRDRLLTMTSVMSRTGEPAYGQSTPDAYALLTAPPATDRAGVAERAVQALHVWGSPAHRDEERVRELAERAYDRAFDPAGVGRQFRAVSAAGSWAEELPGVTTPTLVMHGNVDTLIDISGGRRTAELIPGALFVEIDGMGHDYPPAFWQRWIDEWTAFVAAHPS